MRSETKTSALPYRCHDCGAAYCKLWREYNTIASVTKLLCVDCALKDQKKDWKVNEDGHHVDEHGHRGSDQIGWLVPAVPTAEGDTYWGYTSVPLAGCRWWTALPLREVKDPPRRA